MPLLHRVSDTYCCTSARRTGGMQRQSWIERNCSLQARSLRTMGTKSPPLVAGSCFGLSAWIPYAIDEEGEHASEDEYRSM